MIRTHIHYSNESILNYKSRSQPPGGKIQRKWGERTITYSTSRCVRLSHFFLFRTIQIQINYLRLLQDVSPSSDTLSIEEFWKTRFISEWNYKYKQYRCNMAWRNLAIAFILLISRCSTVKQGKTGLRLERGISCRLLQIRKKKKLFVTHTLKIVVFLLRR